MGDWAMWVHLRPMVDVLEGGDACVSGQERWRIADYVIIHLETMHSDVQTLEERLCAVAGYCQLLPPLPVMNRGFDRSPPPSWQDLWNDFQWVMFSICTVRTLTPLTMATIHLG